MSNSINNSILKTEPSMGYALLDSGEGEKLERYGEIVLSRPDPQALWPKNLPVKAWKEAQASFSRTDRSGWVYKAETPSRWEIGFGGLKFWIRPSAFKHTGLFPEQLPNWSWMEGLIIEALKHGNKKQGLGIKNKELSSGERISVLNLFGYTGGASLACAKAGAEVVHLDGSKSAIGWARENAELSGLADKPIRWILDDARVFLKREIKRGRKYDGIIMDPPAFGHGPNGEMWKIEENFLELMDLCRQVLSDNPLFVLINGYASGYSAIAYQNNLEKMMKDFKGKISIGELTLEEEKSGRLLPAGIFARWEKS